MSTASQIDLPLFKADPKSPNFSFMIELLTGKDWQTSRELLTRIGRPDTDGNRRSLRAVAEASEGRIAGGQKGYKLVEQMTAEEFHHYRNWMLSQTTKMERRILQSDKVFYGRKPVPATL